MTQFYLSKRLRSNVCCLLTAFLIVGTLLLLPSRSAVLLAQAVPNACKNDAGAAVIPSAGAGVGAWMLLLNFNHAPSTTTTTGCLIITTALNPQKVSRTLVACPLLNNDAVVAVGNGTSPFDGKFSISCPGVAQGKQTLKNFTIWGRASFASANTAYAIVTHQDVSFSASLAVNWRVNFNSRYGSNNFSSGHPSFNLMGQTVSFTSAISRLTGSHALNQGQLTPLTTVTPFEFNHNQPFTIGAAGQVWTLAEMIIDPPGGCCKG